MTDDRNCLSFWFPPLEKAGLPVPDTWIVKTDVELMSLLDGVKPERFDAFIEKLAIAAREVGVPCFLRTGLGSGKHEWSRTCYVTDPANLDRHVYWLVEWSHLVDMMGLDHQVWAVRKLIETTPLFHAFNGMPITREFRAFVRGGERRVIEGIYPYWPAESIVKPDADDWRERLARASEITPSESLLLSELAAWAVKEIGGGFWSVDFLQDASGEWWLTDMADGDRSWRPDEVAPRAAA